MPARSILCRLVAGLLLTAPAYAGTAPPLGEWGNFSDPVARCQNAIGRAASFCATLSIRRTNRCLGAELDGGICDRDSLDAATAAAEQRAASLVQRYCDETAASELGYSDLAAALASIESTCREADTAVVSSVWGPIMAGGRVAAAQEPERSCVSQGVRATGRLLRYAMRFQQRALNRIADEDLSPSEREVELARVDTILDRVRDRSRKRILSSCSPTEFEEVYGRSIDAVLDSVVDRVSCVNGLVYVVDAGLECPAPVCGNGVQETGEECDDGNDFVGDECGNDCTIAECETFPSTFDLIQRAIFENRGCTSELCHGSANPAAGLDLTAGNSYQAIVDRPATTAQGYKIVDPGNRANSLLWINVAAKVLDDVRAPLRAMPVGPDSLTFDEVEALRLWIESGGATRSETVPGTAELLDACLPEPEPIAIPPLEPPAPNEGIQLHMPMWYLEPESESEVCYTSYYDLTGQIPAQFLSADGKSFHYNRVEIRQDPLSHHLIVDFFRGNVEPDDPIWGTYRCTGGAKDGQVCNPTALGFCGDGDCATAPDHDAIACIGFGPQQGLSTLTSGGFAFAQETTTVFDFPQDVYDTVPIKGNVLWNSHAFNLSRRRGKLEAWVNILFPEPDEQIYPQTQIFNVNKIFWDVPFVDLSGPRQLMPFEEFETCHIHTFGRPPDRYADSPLPVNRVANLFEISGHMHEHGKRFQVFRGMFECEGGAEAGEACSPYQPEMCPQSTCSEVGGRDPEDALLYTNFIYNDPLVVRFEDPLRMPGTDPVEDRSLTYCAHYDNGATDIQEVKRRSTSPPGGNLFGAFRIGGPCAVSETRCIGGPNHNQLCNGNDSFCDSSGGAGDGDCDACPLTGGFRTQDEMFILFGNYWLTDD